MSLWRDQGAVPLLISMLNNPSAHNRRAAAEALGRIGAKAAVPLPPSELSALLDELYRLTEAEGRDPKALTISYKAPVYDVGQKLVGPGGERRPFSGGQAQIADDIAAFARLGVSEIVFDFRSENLAESLERMERFAPVVRQTAGL